MPTDQYKIDWTDKVAQFEGFDATTRVQYGGRWHDDLLAATPWDDSHFSVFGSGWDTYQNLVRRLADARNTAMQATHTTSTGAAVGDTRQRSVADAAWTGAQQGAAEGAANLRTAAESLADTVQKAAGPGLGIVFAVLLLALYFRARG